MIFGIQFKARDMLFTVFMLYIEFVFTVYSIWESWMIQYI
ncbi:Protein of unknown function [Bacillus cereus]|nr:Protein of unknown function [Bacillus cereus]